MKSVGYGVLSNTIMKLYSKFQIIHSIYGANSTANVRSATKGYSRAKVPEEEEEKKDKLFVHVFIIVIVSFICARTVENLCRMDFYTYIFIIAAKDKDYHHS